MKRYITINTIKLDLVHLPIKCACVYDLWHVSPWHELIQLLKSWVKNLTGAPLWILTDTDITLSSNLIQISLCGLIIRKQIIKCYFHILNVKSSHLFYLSSYASSIIQKQTIHGFQKKKKKRKKKDQQFKNQKRV